MANKRHKPDENREDAAAGSSAAMTGHGYAERRSPDRLSKLTFYRWRFNVF